MPLYDVVILDVDDTGGKEKGTIIEVGPTRYPWKWGRKVVPPRFLILTVDMTDAEAAELRAGLQYREHDADGNVTFWMRSKHKVDVEQITAADKDALRTTGKHTIKKSDWDKACKDDVAAAKERKAAKVN